MPTVLSDPLKRYVENNDPEAFRHLVQEYQHLVYGTCRRILGSTGDVDDAVQETFLKLARKAAEIRSNPGAWLHACAHTTALNVRKARLQRSRKEKPLYSEDPSVAEAVQDRGDDESIVDQCLGELSPLDREVVVSYFFVEETQERIAERIGVSNVAVKKRIDKVLEILRLKFLRRGLAVSGAMAAFLSDLHAQSEIPAGLACHLSAITPTSAAATHSTALVAATGSKAGAAKIIAVGMALALGAAGSAAWWNSMPAKAVSSPVSVRWDFTAGGIDDLKPIEGRWRWQQLDGDGVMTPEIDQDLIVRLPQKFAAVPIRIRIAYLNIPGVPRTSGAAAQIHYVDDSDRIIPHLQSIKPYVINPALGVTFMADCYVFDRYIIQTYDGVPSRIAIHATPYEVDHLCLHMRNFQVTSIEILPLKREDIPSSLCDPGAFIREQHWPEPTTFAPILSSPPSP